MFALSLLLAFAVSAPTAASLPQLEVHPGGHYLQTTAGQPFFWLGDTAWELIHRLTHEETSYYLHTRARQGFTVIQTVVLAEMNGVREPAAFGEKPFLDDDVRRPNPAYFRRIREIVDEAAANGLYVALLPTWGDKLTAPWGQGPRLFRLDNLPDARQYARYLATQLRDCSNVIWILGGDRPARLQGSSQRNIEYARKIGFPPDQDWTPIWRELAAGLSDGLGRKPVIFYHPQGGPQTSSYFLHNEPWLSGNGLQSGHGGGHDVPVWDYVSHDYRLSPAKPTLDLEPNYEDHPYNPWPEWNPATGYFRDHDVRKQTYRSVFAGGCGVTYGHHAIWGFASTRYPAINHADRDWVDALQRPAGRQMQFLRALIESRPFFTRIPDQFLLPDGAGDGPLHMQATRDQAGTYALLYVPTEDQKFKVDLTRLQAGPIHAWWFDPRTGVGTLIGEINEHAVHAFQTPPYGPDWVLVLDSAAAHYPPPGLPRMHSMADH